MKASVRKCKQRLYPFFVNRYDDVKVNKDEQTRGIRQMTTKGRLRSANNTYTHVDASPPNPAHVNKNKQTRSVNNELIKANNTYKSKCKPS